MKIKGESDRQILKEKMEEQQNVRRKLEKEHQLKELNLRQQRLVYSKDMIS